MDSTLCNQVVQAPEADKKHGRGTLPVHQIGVKSSVDVLLVLSVLRCLRGVIRLSPSERDV
jgi:hypothetical protein